MAAKVQYSKQSRTDLHRIWAWIASTSGEKRAKEIVARVAARISVLEQHPLMGRPHPEIDETARMLVVMRWLVLYAVHE